MNSKQPQPLTYRGILEYSRAIVPTPGELRSIAMMRVQKMSPGTRALLAEITAAGLSGGHPDLGAYSAGELAVVRQMYAEEVEARAYAATIGCTLEEARRSVALSQEIDARKAAEDLPTRYVPSRTPVPDDDDDSAPPATLRPTQAALDAAARARARKNHKG